MFKRLLNWLGYVPKAMVSDYQDRYRRVCYRALAQALNDMLQSQAGQALAALAFSRGAQFAGAENPPNEIL